MSPSGRSEGEHRGSQPGPGSFGVTLDAAALARLRELDPDGRHGVVGRVLKAFQGSLARMLRQLAAEAAREGGGDAATVAGVAHTLKSSSASVGALALAQTCAAVESRLRSGEAGSLHGDIESLLEEGQAALAAVEAMLRD